MLRSKEPLGRQIRKKIKQSLDVKTFFSAELEILSANTFTYQVDNRVITWEE
jgi:hypothetical protein